MEIIIVIITAILALLLFLGCKQFFHNPKQPKLRNRTLKDQPPSTLPNTLTDRPTNATESSPHSHPLPGYPPLIRSNAFGPLASTPMSASSHEIPRPENFKQEYSRPRRLFSEPKPESDNFPAKN